MTEEPGSRTDRCSIALNVARGRDAHHIFAMLAWGVADYRVLQCAL